MRKKRVAKLFIYLILVLFLFSYALEKSGYYEYNLQDKKNLTNEEIKQFEEDVKSGKDIDINDYLKSNKVDYSNKLTKTASSVSLNLNKYLKKTLNNTFDILGKLVK